MTAPRHRSSAALATPAAHRLVGWSLLAVAAAIVAASPHANAEEGISPTAAASPMAGVPPVSALALTADKPPVTVLTPEGAETARKADQKADADAASSGAPEADRTVQPPTRWASSAELSGGAYRLSASRGALDIGMNFATPSRSVHASDQRPELGAPVIPTLPSLSLGLRRAGATPTASSLLSRATGGSGDSYVSKLGVEWKPAQSQVNFLREGLGFRLDGNDRMTVRLRKGVIGLYMHRKF